MIPKEVKELEKTLKIFGNANRLAALRLLKDGEEKSVGEIADHLEVPFKTASTCLLFLTKKGLLRRRYDGSFVLYGLAPNLSKSASIITALL